MDKLLIAAGASLIWIAYNDQQKRLVEVVSTPGFAGTMAIMGGLMVVAQYAPKAQGYAAASSALVALGLWNSYYGKSRPSLTAQGEAFSP